MKIHQWTHNGSEVLVLRFCDHKGLTFNDYVPKTGFQYPLTVGEEVTAPDWDASPKCGGGLHGWPWGMFVGDGKNPEWNQLWQVYGCKPEDVVPCDSDWGKVKFRSGTLRFSGNWEKASNFVLAGQMDWVFKYADKTAAKDGKIASGPSSASAATGPRSASAATGPRSASAATGDSSASAATGYSSASAATGDSSASAATGDSSASAATGPSSASAATGDRSASAATGYSTCAIATGQDSRAKAGKYGCIALGWWNPKALRMEMRCALIGNGKDKKLKPDTWYQLNASGKFVEVKGAAV